MRAYLVKGLMISTVMLSPTASWSQTSPPGAQPGAGMQSKETNETKETKDECKPDDYICQWLRKPKGSDHPVARVPIDDTIKGSPELKEWRVPPDHRAKSNRVTG